MNIEKILIITLFVLALAGLIWSASSFFLGKKKLKNNTAENFKQAIQAELSDICQAPDGYTDEEWFEHMSHHPDRYQECLSSQEKQINYGNVSPDDLAEMLKTKDFYLIDVHIPEQSHIPATDNLIPFNEIEDQISNLPQDKDAKIVLYCRSGNMSVAASEKLIKMGYTNVYNLEGGLNAWTQSGYEVDNKSIE